MEHLGETRYSISKLTGISEATLSQFFNLKRDMGSEKLLIILDYLHLEIKPKQSYPVGMYISKRNRNVNDKIIKKGEIKSSKELAEIFECSEDIFLLDAGIDFIRIKEKK